MENICFKASYGDQDREVNISKVSGSMGMIHIYIDKYYNGTIGQKQGKWEVRWVEPVAKSVHQEIYGKDDSDAILDRLKVAGWI